MHLARALDPLYTTFAGVTPVEVAPAAPLAEVASAATLSAFDGLVPALAALKEGSAPHDDEVKKLRKNVLQLRNQLNIFAHVYAGPRHQRVGDELRSVVAAGYSVIGAFKDLFTAKGLTLAVRDAATGAWGPGVRPDAVRYPQRELKHRRGEMQAWASRCRDVLDSPPLRELLAKPGPPRAVKKGELSSHYGGTLEEGPLANENGLDWLRRLAGGTFVAAQQERVMLVKLEMLANPEAEKAFHDFRKRLRSIGDLLLTFPQLLGSAPLAKVGELMVWVDDIGLVQDTIIASATAARRGHKRKVVRRDKVVQQQWVALRARLDSAAFEDLLRELAASVRGGTTDGWDESSRGPAGQ